MQRMLLVDDDPKDREHYGKGLSRDLGFELEIVEATNGQEAVNYLSGNLQSPPDIVLMDLQMPEMDGAKATRKMREMGYRNPLILWSTDPFEIEKLTKQNPGATEISNKAMLSLEDLRHLVSKYLRGGTP